MTLKQVKEMITKFPTVQGVCLAGFGEPLLLPELPEIVSYLKSRNIYIGLITNGLLLDHFPDVADMCDYVSVSLNSAAGEEYSETTGANKFEKVIENIKLTTKFHSSVYLSFVMGQFNKDKYVDYIRLSETLGVKMVHLHNLLPHGDMEYFNANILREPLERIHSTVEYSLPTVVPETHPSNCQSPFMSLGIDGDGNISGCRRVDMPQKENGKFMSLNYSSDTYLNKIRNRVQTNTDICKHCFGNVVG